MSMNRVCVDCHWFGNKLESQKKEVLGWRQRCRRKHSIKPIQHQQHHQQHGDDQEYHARR